MSEDTRQGMAKPGERAKPSVCPGAAGVGGRRNVPVNI